MMRGGRAGGSSGRWGTREAERTVRGVRWGKVECSYGRSRTSPRTGPARPGGAHEKKRRERRYPNRHRSHRAPKIATAAIHYRTPHVYVSWPNKFPSFYNGDLCSGLSTTTEIARTLAPDFSCRGKQRTRVSWKADSTNVADKAR